MNCKNCNKNIENEVPMICPNCNAQVCQECSEKLQNICPYCYSTLDYKA